MKKLILTDLDHTLLKTDGTISERTLDVLKRCREKGCTFAIATARYVFPVPAGPTPRTMVFFRMASTYFF